MQDNIDESAKWSAGERKLGGGSVRAYTFSEFETDDGSEISDDASIIWDRRSEKFDFRGRDLAPLTGKARAALVDPPPGINSAPNIYIGNLPTTTGVFIGPGNIISVNSSVSPAVVSIDGSVTCTGQISQPRCWIRVARTILNQNISHNTITSIAWPQIEASSNFPFTAGSGATVLTIPISGLYSIEYNVIWLSGTAVGMRSNWVEFDTATPGTNRRYAYSTETPANAGFNWGCSSSVQINCIAGTTVLLAAFQTSGASLALTGGASAGKYCSYMDIVRLSE